MKKQLLVLIFILFASVTFAQKKYEAHEVKAGETLYSLAIRYNTSVKKLLKYNPSISKESELPLGKFLIVPSKQKTEASASYRMHYVKKRETLFGLALKYDVSEEAIQQANPIIKEKGLMCGLEIRIPNKVNTDSATTPKDTTDTANGVITHTVAKGETIYSITHQYGISKETFYKLNPQIIGNDLPLGTILLIKKSEETEEIATVKKDTIYTKHIVLPKETVYSITHLYNIPKEQLIALNPNYPELKNNILHPDDVLIVKQLIIKTDTATNSIDTTFVAEKKPLLSRIIKGKNLDIALLLPIHLNQLPTSNRDSLSKVIENKVALNRVLDFYNGSMLALDSIAKLGVNISIDVHDTESNKSVALLKLIRENKLVNKDVIIGPFFADNVNLVAQNSAEKTLIVAPFNKKPSPYPQVLNAKVSKALLGTKMLDYMADNHTDEKIIYIDDEQNPKALAAVLARFNEVKVLKPNEKTKAISIENIQKAVGVTEEGKLIDATKTQNYWVIVNSNKDWFIGSIVSAFNSLQGTVNITLFSTGRYKAFNEINPNHLAHLNYHFPATSNIDATATPFSKKYYTKFGVYPSITATKGFDATFDALLRASVAENITSTLLYEHNKGAMTDFQYNKTASGSYQNEAVQILKYTKDLHQVSAESIKVLDK